MRKTHFNGIVLLDKPTGLSSHDAVDKVRRLAGQRAVGHTGTLDPLASGLLVLCLGHATKVSRYLSGCDKRYEAEIHLGLTSSTLDAEGVDENQQSLLVPDISEEQVDRVLSSFNGEIRQTVPLFSAVHVDGKRLYDLARQGEMPTLPERTVRIHSIERLQWNRPVLSIAVRCGAGTYIRSLADAIGRQIGCGAYLSQLRRTSVGSMNLSAARSLEQLERLTKAGRFHECLKSISEILDFSAIEVTPEFSASVVNGPGLTASDIVAIRTPFSAGDHVLLTDQTGTALAVGTAVVDSEQCRHSLPETIFAYERVLR